MKILIRLILVFALFGSINLSAQKITVTYSNAGTYSFTVPIGATSVNAEAIGGGGGGGNATASSGAVRSGAAGGGGAGGCIVSSGISTNVSYSITVGSGGGSAAAGTATSIGSLSAAGGAGGGSVSAGSSDFFKGAGGSNCRAGEAGYDAGSAGSAGATGGLGGGSSHSRATCGNNAATKGNAGTFPGGGGGGAAAFQGALQSGTESAPGGAGATGRATITFDLSTPILAALNNRTQYCPDYPVKFYVAGTVASNVTYQLYNGSTLVANLDNANAYSYETSAAGTYMLKVNYTYNYSGTAPSISPTTNLNTTTKTFTMQSNSITVTAGSICPPICTTGGTLLFRESFEDPNDPYSPSNPVNTYIYAGGCAWMKSYDAPDLNNWAWSVCDDHTYPNDIEKGYYLYVNIDDAATMPTVMFYQMTMPELCNDAKLTVSFWLANMVVMPDIFQPDLEINVYKEGDASKTCLITGGKYKTGKIQPGYTRNGEGRPFATWNKYFFPITLPAGVTSVVLEITNLQTNGSGNDLLFDDFEVRFCTPAINISSPSGLSITECSSVNLAGNYTDDGSTFGNNLVARWEYSASNNVSNPSLWTPVAGTQTTSSNGTISLNNTVTQSGYYRFVVSNSANINSYNCRAMSNVITVTVQNCYLKVNPKNRIEFE